MRHGGHGERRLLLIPFAPGIGDMVMMEPLLRALLTAVPDWRLTVVAREYAAELLQPANYELASPFYFVSEPPRPLRPLHRMIPQRLIAWAAEPAMYLDLGPFDRVMNLFWIWESRVPFDRWWTPRWPPQEGVRHTVDLLADYLEEELEVEIPRTERVPRLRVFPEAADWADSYLSGHGVSGRKLATLVVSAANSLKWWAAPKWIDLNDRLCRNGWQTLLVAPSDHSHARQVHEGSRGTLLWPGVGLRQVAALLARSDVVVGIDTGPLHMASALGVPWVGLFGPTNPDLIGPYDRSRGSAVMAHFPKPHSCKDCWLAFKGREDRCLTLPISGCTALIPVEDVLDAISAVCQGTRIASSRRFGREIKDD